MIKLMVVEDEKILCEGICRVGNWEALGVEICGTAENGKEALQKIQENKPDIILTDVVMPVMDGIALAGKVYEQHPEIRLVFLSGHEEFEYVRQAMEYRACHYLLKPAKIEKIEEVVAELRDDILKEREKAQEEARLHKKLEQSMPILREHYMNQLLLGTESDEERILHQFAFLNIPLQSRYTAVMICQPDHDLAGGRTAEKLILLQLQEICQAVAGRDYETVVFTDLKDRTVIAVNVPQAGWAKSVLPDLQEKASRIQMEAETRMNLSVSLGIGRMSYSISDLARAYREAEYALGYRFFMGNRSVIYIGDVEKDDDRNIISLEQQEEELITCIKAGDLAGVELWSTRYFESMARCAVGGQSFVYEEMNMFIGLLLRELRGKVLEGEQDFLTELENLREALRNRGNHAVLTEWQEQISAVLQSIAKKIRQNRTLRNEGLIEKAKKYICQNLSGDVSLITVADMVYVSPNYLSFLFRESGENFKDYVVKTKMQRATEMMQNSSYSLGQIAAALGYRDGRYFSQVYKKYQEGINAEGGGQK